MSPPVRQLAALHTVAARQHRAVTRRQLLEAGYTPGDLRGWLRRGLVHEAFRGVYVVGRPELTPAEFAAASLLLAGGSRRAAGDLGVQVRDRAVPGPAAAIGLEACAGGSCGLAGVTGAEARGLLEARTGIVHVAATSPGNVRRRASQLPVIDADGRVHPAELRLHPIEQHQLLPGAWPLTTVPRMLVDAAGQLPAWRMRQLWREAEFKGLLDPAEIERELSARRARGVRALRELMAGSFPAVVAGEELRSRKEAAMARLLARLPLPRPEFNVQLRVGGGMFALDGLWVDVGLAYEIDAGQHNLPERIEHDKARDLELFAIGIDIVRVTVTRLESASAWCERLLLAAYARQLARAEPALRARIDALRI